jgi:hypothetical protein
MVLVASEWAKRKLAKYNVVRGPIVFYLWFLAFAPLSHR